MNRFLFLVRQWEWWVMLAIWLPAMMLFALMAALVAAGKALVFIGNRLDSLSIWMNAKIERYTPTNRLYAKIKVWKSGQAGKKERGG